MDCDFVAFGFHPAIALGRPGFLGVDFVKVSMKALRVLFLTGAIAVATVGTGLAGNSLFIVSPNGGPVSITLCLNGSAPITCQKVTVPAQTLRIATTTQHTYPTAGIKVDTAGYVLANRGTDCRPASNGYCLFAVSATRAVSITLSRAKKPTP